MDYLKPSLVMDRDAVRWYILRLPECHQGHAVALEMAKTSRLRDGDLNFDYLAPTFKEKRVRGGREVLVDVSTLYNYVFVHSSVAAIFELKQTFLSAYNFMRRYEYRGNLYFPYVKEDVMESLRWVASSYKNVVPCYVPGTSKLMRGDIIRFTSGSLAGKTAEIVNVPGTKHREFILRIRIEDGSSDNGGSGELFSIPIRVAIEDCTYVVEQLNVDDKQLYARLDNIKLLTFLFMSLVRQRQTFRITGECRVKCEDMVRQYGSVCNIETDILRSKLLVYLLPAYRLLGMKREYDESLKIATAFVDMLKARQAKILLCLTLFACTAQYHWRTHAAELLAQPEKSAASVKRAEQYTAWLQLLTEGYEPVSLRQKQDETIRTTFPALLEPLQDGAALDIPEVDPAPKDVPVLLDEALNTRDAAAILALRPHLLNGTYPIAVNDNVRALTLHLLWATQSMPADTPAALHLKALLYKDALRCVK